MIRRRQPKGGMIRRRQPKGGEMDGGRWRISLWTAVYRLNEC